MKYYLCAELEKFDFTINGPIEDGITFCCEKGVTRTKIFSTPEETYRAVNEFRQNMIMAGIQLATKGTISDIMKGCLKCPKFKKKEWRENDKIYFVNISTYPAPCQCRCIYCAYWRNNRMMSFRQQDKQQYERLFELINYLEKKELISPDAYWQVASGEITIHPMKSEIYTLVKDKHVELCSNGFIYDEDLASLLKTNPLATINISIDAGTAETWKKVKGFDNFEKVLGNLKRYRNVSRSGQICLKYIILPGINDSKENFKKVLEIANDLDVKKFVISRDLASKNKEKDWLSAQILIDMCTQKGQYYELSLY